MWRLNRVSEWVATSGTSGSVGYAETRVVEWVSAVRVSGESGEGNEEGEEDEECGGQEEDTAVVPTATPTGMTATTATATATVTTTTDATATVTATESNRQPPITAVSPRAPRSPASPHSPSGRSPSAKARSPKHRRSRRSTISVSTPLAAVTEEAESEPEGETLVTSTHIISRTVANLSRSVPVRRRAFSASFVDSSPSVYSRPSTPPSGPRPNQQTPSKSTAPGPQTPGSRTTPRTPHSRIVSVRSSTIISPGRSLISTGSSSTAPSFVCVTAAKIESAHRERVRLYRLAAQGAAAAAAASTAAEGAVARGVSGDGEDGEGGSGAGGRQASVDLGNAGNDGEEDEEDPFAHVTRRPRARRAPLAHQVHSGLSAQAPENVRGTGAWAKDAPSSSPPTSPVAGERLAAPDSMPRPTPAQLYYRAQTAGLHAGPSACLSRLSNDPSRVSHVRTQPKDEDDTSWLRRRSSPPPSSSPSTSSSTSSDDYYEGGYTHPRRDPASPSPSPEPTTRPRPPQPRRFAVPDRRAHLSPKSLLAPRAGEWYAPLSPNASPSSTPPRLFRGARGQVGARGNGPDGYAYDNPTYYPDPVDSSEEDSEYSTEAERPDTPTPTSSSASSPHPARGHQRNSITHPSLTTSHLDSAPTPRLRSGGWRVYHATQAAEAGTMAYTDREVVSVLSRVTVETHIVVRPRSPQDASQDVRAGDQGGQSGTRGRGGTAGLGRMSVDEVLGMAYRARAAAMAEIARTEMVFELAELAPDYHQNGDGRSRNGNDNGNPNANGDSTGRGTAPGQAATHPTAPTNTDSGRRTLPLRPLNPFMPPSASTSASATASTSTSTPASPPPTYDVDAELRREEEDEAVALLMMRHNREAGRVNAASMRRGKSMGKRGMGTLWRLFRW